MEVFWIGSRRKRVYGLFFRMLSCFSKKYISFHVDIIMNQKGGNNMERKTLGILALALIGLFAVSLVVAMPFGSLEDRDAMKSVVETGDYDAWKALKMAQLSEESFEKKMQLHELKNQVRDARDAGDMETVSALISEIMELMPENQMGYGKGFGKGREIDQAHGGCPFAN